MATETKPTTGTIWLNNLVMAAGVSVGAAAGEQNYSRATNLLDPLRTRRYRTTPGTVAQVDIDLGASYAPGVALGIRGFGLIDCNAVAGTAVTLYTIDGIGGSVVATFGYTAYARARVNQTLRWYVGASNAGTLAASSRYYRVALASPTFGIGGDDADSVDLFHQIGNIWLGDYTEIGYEHGVRIRAKDPSGKGESRGGDVYHDVFPVFHEVQLTVPLLEAAQLYPVMKEGLDKAGSSTRVLLDLHATSVLDYECAHGCFYGRVDNSGQNLRFSKHGDLSIDFEEDRRGG